MNQRCPRRSICGLALLSAALLVALLPTTGTGHESDQYTVPAGREFADLRLYFAHEIHDLLESAVRKTNARIAQSLQDGQPTARTEHLQQPGTIAQAVLFEFPPVMVYIETMELRLRNPKVRGQYPGLVVAYLPTFWIYHHWALLLDPTKLVRLGRSSTIMIDGHYLGTDKLAHFFHMGYIYYNDFRRGLEAGVSEEEARNHAFGLGAGGHPIFSENALLGMFTTGVRSNADLAANYTGFKFFRNLTEEVRIRGEMQPPMLVRDGVYWRLNDHVHPHSDFFTIFVTDHWDEALNPSTYGPGIGACIKQELRRRCGSLHAWYRDEHGRPHPREYFAERMRELSTYYGEDYGHQGVPEEMVSIANCCFEDEATTGADEGGDQKQVMLVSHATADNDMADTAAVDAPDQYGRTALWWAARHGDLAEISRLLAAEAEVDAADIDGETPLHCAARWGFGAVAELLLQGGADPQSAGLYGVTPLHLAARGLYEDVIQALLAHGADVDARDAFGCTALHDVAARSAPDLVAKLVEAGASPLATDNQGTTPLHRAAREGDARTVALLLTLGAERDRMNHAGRRPYDEALASGNRDLPAALTPTTEPQELLLSAAREDDEAASDPQPQATHDR